MLKIAGIALILILVVALALALTGRKSVHAELDINATPAEIWAIVVNTAAYDEWNPILVAADGEFVEGGTVNYQMKMGEGDPVPVSPRTITLIPEKQLTQYGGNDLVLSYRHTWQLEPIEGGTRATQKEEYKGIGVWFWDPSDVEKLYQQGLEAVAARIAGENNES